MKRIRIAISALIATAAVTAPFLFVLAIAYLTPPMFDETFVGALDEKYERLNSQQEDKIVFVGGSSVAFGLDSERLEEYTGMPVVNFGLYAALGTRLMLDLSLSGINEGDIVVVSPEINRETLSLYFNADTTWRAVEGDFSMLRYISLDNMPAMAGSLFGYAQDKLKLMYANRRESGENEIYKSEHFNKYGDFSGIKRTENIMSDYYDKNTGISLDLSDYTDDLDEFIDYLNRYINKCRDRGAEVYFCPSPMNELAITDSSDAVTRAEFFDYLENKINCDFLLGCDDSIMEAGYFFDTNYHLNDAGVAVRTIRLGKSLKLALGITLGVITDEEPSAPPLPEISIRFDGYDENSLYFTYEKRENGTYAITGLTDEGKKMTSLTVPLGAFGYRITAIGEGAFEGSCLRQLTVTENSYLGIFENGAFWGASELCDLYIYKTTGDDIAPPANFVGVHTDFCVHVPIGSDFAYHYYWSERGLIFVYF